MMPKSMVIIADGLARNIFMEHCRELDATIEIELRKAFSKERISEKRIDRIVKLFSENMRGVK